jgi:Domain of unknown function (DUF6378)
MVADATNRPDAGDILRLAFETVNARGADYDKANDIEQNFREAAAIASVVLGKEITPRDVSMILVCVKLIRAKSSPGKLDNYVDAVNYMAFSACFAGLVPLPPLVKEIKKPQDATAERQQAASQVAQGVINAVNQRGAA